MKLRAYICDTVRSLYKRTRQMWCKHVWVEQSIDRYALMRSDGSKEGEVTLSLLDCKKCGASKLMPSNRAHQ